MRRSWMFTILVVGLLAAACSADPETLTPSDAEPANGNGAVDVDGDSVAEAGFSILGSLEQIPASAADDAQSALQISVADLDAAAEQAGLTRPGGTTDPDELLSFFGPLTGLPRDEMPMRMFVLLPQLFATASIGLADEFAAEMGFSVGEVSSFVALEAPPTQFVVVTGVSAPDELPEVVPGVRTIGEGDDFAPNLEERTAARQLGRPLRVAERDGRLALSLATVPIIDWITGPTAGTLADDPTLAALASRLDEAQVVSAALVVPDDEPWAGVGLGWAADDAGARGVIVFSYDSASAAEDQLALIEGAFQGESFATREPISELIALESIEVRGAEIVAEIRFPDDRPPSTLWTMLVRRDLPFASAS